MRRNFYATPKVEKSNEREKIFQTKCIIKDNVYDLTIDRDGESTCDSRGLVKKLDIKTNHHPHLYILRCLNDQIGTLVNSNASNARTWDPTKTRFCVIFMTWKLILSCSKDHSSIAEEFNMMDSSTCTP